MSTILLLIFVTLSVIFSLYTKNKIKSRRLNRLQKSLEESNPDIRYEYNRYNTKRERNTTVLINGKNFEIKCDIQNIKIYNQTLVSKISSYYKKKQLVFDLVVQPFIKDLIEIEGYKNLNKKGIIIFWSYGGLTKSGLDEITELSFLKDHIPHKPGGVFFKLNSYTVDGAENSVKFFGEFEDKNIFTVTINYKDYLMELHAPLISLKNTKNYKDMEHFNEQE